MNSPVTFLFTSVGRRVELMRHFLAYQEQHPDRLRVLGTEIDPHAPAAQVLGEAVTIVPRVDDPSYPETMAEICHSQRVDAAFPLIDPDIPRLGRDDVEVPLASVTPAAAEMVSDKLETFTWLSENGVPTPHSWVPQVCGEPSVPCFMKPRRGSGGVDALKVRDEVEYDFFRRYIPQPIAQELLAGPEVTVDVIVGRRREVLATVQRKRLAVRGGEVTRGEVISDPVIDGAVQATVRALEPIGPVTVQGMYAEDGSFKVTEINARMGGGLPLAIAAGVPVADLLVRSWAGETVEPVRPEVGLRMVRFDDSLFYRP